jgi:hypothetical protein
MAQHDDKAGAASGMLSPDTKADRTQDDVSIFSASGLEAVFQWWLESNRRWTEQNGANALVLPSVVQREAQ